MKKLVACLLALLICSTATKAQGLSPDENSFLTAIELGNAQQARELVRSGKVDPSSIGGRPAITWLGMSAPAVSQVGEPVWLYLTQELKQSLDANWNNANRSVFSTLCSGLLVPEKPAEGQAHFKRTMERIRQALRAGASVTGMSQARDAQQVGQPLPACADTYLRVKEGTSEKREMLALLAELLAKGADPNQYDLLVLRFAAEELDADLFSLLVKHGGKTGDVIPARSGIAACPFASSVKTNVLSALPDPDDRAIPRAKAFLGNAIALGVNLTSNLPRISGRGSCQHVDETLRQKASRLGASEYAKMVMALEQQIATRPRGDSK